LVKGEGFSGRGALVRGCPENQNNVKGEREEGIKATAKSKTQEEKAISGREQNKRLQDLGGT